MMCVSAGDWGWPMAADTLGPSPAPIRRTDKRMLLCARSLSVPHTAQCVCCILARPVPMPHGSVTRGHCSCSVWMHTGWVLLLLEMDHAVMQRRGTLFLL